MIATVGFYQHTGDWLYTSGIPAKTGVGGGVMGVMPGVMGISAFAPPLDDAGNSVKAQLAIKYIMNKTGHERIQRAPHPRAIIYSILTEKPIFLSPREKYRLF